MIYHVQIQVNEPAASVKGFKDKGLTYDQILYNIKQMWDNELRELCYLSDEEIRAVVTSMGIINEGET